MSTRGDTIAESNLQRELRGVTATLSDGTVLHRQGRVRESLQAVARFCDAWELKVESLSTPRTILADLRGRTNGEAIEDVPKTMFPEVALMKSIGRVDLLALGLQGRSAQAERGRRAREAGPDTPPGGDELDSDLGGEVDIPS